MAIQGWGPISITDYVPSLSYPQCSDLLRRGISDISVMPPPDLRSAKFPSCSSHFCARRFPTTSRHAVALHSQRCPLALSI